MNTTYSISSIDLYFKTILICFLKSFLFISTYTNNQIVLRYNCINMTYKSFKALILIAFLSSIVIESKIILGAKVECLFFLITLLKRFTFT